jgi:2-methylisocitrate lyase-like PEP mutase family enzyme
MPESGRRRTASPATEHDVHIALRALVFAPAGAQVATTSGSSAIAHARATPDVSQPETPQWTPQAENP